MAGNCEMMPLLLALFLDLAQSLQRDEFGSPCPRVVINEISDDPTEFIELFDFGIGNTSLKGLTIVHWMGNGQVLRTLRLSGNTNSEGYYLIADADSASSFPFHQKFEHCCMGCCAAYSLHCGPGNIETITDARKNLLDAGVHNLKWNEPIVRALFWGTHGNIKRSLPSKYSAVRCGCCLDTDLACWDQPTKSTPGEANDCPPRSEKCPEDLLQHCRNEPAGIWSPSTRSCFVYSGIPANFTQAEQICQESAPPFAIGRLAEVSSRDIFSRLKRKNPVGYFWFGVRKSKKSGKLFPISWEYAASPDRPLYDPRPYLGIDLNDQDCLAFSKHKWRGFHCATLLAFICEFLPKN